MQIDKYTMYAYTHIYINIYTYICVYIRNMYKNPLVHPYTREARMVMERRELIQQGKKTDLQKEGSPHAAQPATVSAHQSAACPPQIALKPRKSRFRKRVLQAAETWNLDNGFIYWDPHTGHSKSTVC